jgi:hypothetical protein
MARASEDPAAWLAKIDELERLTDQNEEAAERLIHLLLSYKAAEVETVERQVEAHRTGTASPKQPLPILLTQLVVIAHHALVMLGTSAREALLHAYAAAPPGAQERLWFLLPLADMGDPQLETFFATLEEGDAGPAGERSPVEGLRLRYEAARAGIGRGHGIAMSSGATEFDRMLSALEHESDHLRWRAADALGQLGDPRAIDPLQKLLSDPCDFVRKAAEEALERIGGSLERIGG